MIEHSPIVIYGRLGAWAWCPCGWSTFSWQHQITAKKLEAHRGTDRKAAA